MIVRGYSVSPICSAFTRRDKNGANARILGRQEVHGRVTNQPRLVKVDVEPLHRLPDQAYLGFAAFAGDLEVLPLAGVAGIRVMGAVVDSIEVSSSLPQ